MTSRERVLQALRHEVPDRVPRDFWAEEPAWRRLLAHVGCEDRERLLTVFERLFTDARFQAVKPTAEQRAMMARIADVLGVAPARRRRIARMRKPGAKRAAAAAHAATS